MKLTDAEQAALRRLPKDYGTEAVMEEIADWIGDDPGCAQLADRLRIFNAGFTWQGLEGTSADGEPLL